MNPLKSVCLICVERNAAREVFLGSCFAYQRHTTFVTAAHCVAGRDPNSLVILSPQEGLYSKVVTVSVHPSADIALLCLRSEKEKTVVEPFSAISKIDGIGGEYFAFGYPEDVFGRDAGRPTARLFRGYGQRHFIHRSHMKAGYVYEAIELSFPCPGGLSGGPLFKPETALLIGLVTENIKTTTVLESEEITNTPTQRSTVQYREVINFGIGLLLQPWQEWIDTQIAEGLSS